MNDIMESAHIDEHALVIDMAIDSWRMARLFVRMLSKLDAGEASKYGNQLQFFMDKIQQHINSAGLRLVSLEGQVYDPGMAVKALNLDEFTANDNLLIEQMIEPIVMGADGLIRTGTVILARSEQ